MKKLILIFIAFAGAFQTNAQNINPESDHVPQSNAAPAVIYTGDPQLSRWCIDVNLLGGGLSQQVTSNDAAASYRNLLNPNISDLKFNNGISYGFDAQLAYFFGHERHFGIGAGVLYMYQQGNMTMDQFHVEYQSVDNFGNTFRQLVTSNGQINETVHTNNFNIPLLLKYKTRFSKGIGFTADAGLLFNLQENNAYSTNASFDYEAIYDYTGSKGGITTVYDNSPVPNASDLLITKSQYLGVTPNGNIQNYFNTLRNDGYNVGLGVKPGNNSGNVSYTGSVGLLVRPALSFYLSDHVALNLGLYYLYQNFTHSAPSNYILTDRTGEYSSVLNNVSKAANQSYGISAGLRFYLGSAKAVIVPIPDPAPEEEEEPVAPAPPVQVPEPAPAEPQLVDVSTPILFDLNKTTIKSEYYPVLEEAVKKVNENKNLDLIIHGYADNQGNALYNVALSKKRALAVKNYFRKKGVKAKSLKTVAHGAKSPAESNHTSEGRAQNRRVILQMKEQKH